MAWIVRTNARHSFSKPEGLLLVICDATTTVDPKPPAITVYTDGNHYQSVVAQHISDLIPDRALFKRYKYLHSNELMGGAATQPPKYPKLRPALNACSQCRVTSQQPTCKYPTCSKLASDDALPATFCQPKCWPTCTNQEDKFIPVPVMVYFDETLQCNGIRVDATVSQGTRILEYTGQVYTQQEYLVKRNRRPNIQHYTAQLDPEG